MLYSVACYTHRHGWTPSNGEGNANKNIYAFYQVGKTA